MYMTDFAYDGPIFLVPLSPSYPSSPVYRYVYIYMIFTDIYIYIYITLTLMLVVANLANTKRSGYLPRGSVNNKTLLTERFIL